MKPTLLSLIVALFIAPHLAFAQNKTETSKKELTEKEGVNYNKSSSSSSSSFDDDDSTIFTEIVVPAFMYTIGGIFKYGLIGDYANEDHLHNDLSRYPYQKDSIGNFYNPRFGENKVYVFRMDAKEKLLFSNARLFGNQLEVKIRPVNAFSLKADYFHVLERNTLTGKTDDLALFYFTFAYDRIRFERFNLGWSAGAAYIGSKVNRAGFSWGLNAEYFLIKDFSFLALAQWSAVNGKPVHAYEFDARYHKKNFYLTGGFTQLIIASPHYNFATAGGGIYF